MKEHKVTIWRYNPEEDREPYPVSYPVPSNGRITCLEAMMDIYTRLDSTLAFRYSCRYQKCGLCSCMINGRPGCLCRIRLKEETELKSLQGLPVLRDLVTDRRFLMDFLSQYRVYISAKPLFENEAKLRVPETYYDLIRCRECLCCVSACPGYDFSKKPFCGPYFFVKLAQLHFDPRNRIDRPAQARALGIEQCRNCGKCHCPFGINIFKSAIQPLLTAP